MLDIRETNAGVIIALKVVPNAKNDEIVGLMGDRLKVRVSAPQEEGKANNAACEVVASALKIKKNAVSIVSGNASSMKAMCIVGLSQPAIIKILGVG